MLNKTGSPFRLNWDVAKKDAGKLLRTFLEEQGISKRALTAIKFDGGKLTVNKEEVTVRHVLKTGDTVTAEFPLETGSKGLLPEKLPLHISYEDDYLMVLVKPANMNTIPSREHPTRSLANALLWYYQEHSIAATIHVVTRLDRDTSGLVLVAKHRHIHHLLSEQQKAGKVLRRYEAVVEGDFQEEQGEIEAPIGRKETSIIEREVREDGQYACTKFKVLQSGKNFTHLSLQLLTGRTHQIRVHLAYIGHPLCGDGLYGGQLDRITRQALHCCQITFIHPITGATLTFNEKPPADFLQLLTLIY
ncbi:RluA family pseudouridine synthase [Peribacillus loiseleuriae]|uniref:Pseudouridine synthase n=1 Tax=Peribacillus loiseleuriae TaxID=1679170 RepID=A0A0K9GR88_9BACI|nr:RluA family pseudouridine synthase [Peribacillus loiseleuriae]KMY49106.1 pseudouridine synthase [Peribacillus loiseleuriae]